MMFLPPQDHPSRLEEGIPGLGYVVSPRKARVVGPLPNGHLKWLKDMGVILTTYPNC